MPRVAAQAVATEEFIEVGGAVLILPGRLTTQLAACWWLASDRAREQ